MSKDESLFTQKQFIDAINRNELDRLHNIVSANVIDHDPVKGQIPGAQGYIRFFSRLHKAFPDLRIEIEQMVADDDDSVGFVYTLTGTHLGEYQMITPVGSRIQVRGMQVCRYENGKIAERWGKWDETGILRQLGVAVEV